MYRRSGKISLKRARPRFSRFQVTVPTYEGDKEICEKLWKYVKIMEFCHNGKVGTMKVWSVELYSSMLGWTLDVCRGHIFSGDNSGSGTSHYNNHYLVEESSSKILNLFFATKRLRPLLCLKCTKHLNFRSLIYATFHIKWNRPNSENCDNYWYMLSWNTKCLGSTIIHFWKSCYSNG